MWIRRSRYKVKLFDEWEKGFRVGKEQGYHKLLEDQAALLRIIAAPTSAQVHARANELLLKHLSEVRWG